jgi:hypothetical protein
MVGHGEVRSFAHRIAQGVPFVVAVQDFHMPGAMRWIGAAMSDYVFGVRQSREEEGRFERIEEHVWKKLREKSGFFSFPKSENISAIGRGALTGGALTTAPRPRDRGRVRHRAHSRAACPCSCGGSRPSS